MNKSKYLIHIPQSKKWKRNKNWLFHLMHEKKKKNLRIYSHRISSLRIVQGPRYPFNRNRSATRAMANSIGSTKCWSPATPKRARFIASPHRLKLINIPQKLSIPQNRIAFFNRINRIFFWIRHSNERRRKENISWEKVDVRLTWINSRISHENNSSVKLFVP